MITMQSYLEDYKNGARAVVAIDNFLKVNPKHKLGLAIKRIKDTFELKFDFLETITYLKDFDYNEFEVEEQLIYLFNLFLLYINSERISSAKSIYSMMKSITSENLPPEWQIIHIQAKCELLAKDGFRKQRSLEIEKCLQILQPQSARYKIILWVYLIDLGAISNYTKFDELIKSLKQLNEDHDLQGRTEFALLLKNTDQGYFEKIKSTIDYIKGQFPIGMMGGTFTYLEKLYQIFVKNNFSILDEKIEEDSAFYSCVYLIKNDPVKALYWAKKNPNIMSYYKNESSFISFYLLRAELANGNVNSAKYFLENKRKLDSASLFDDFFWFRIYHIKNDKAKAQYYFDLFANNADKFDLNKRFDIELKLSSEISLTDLRFYSQNRTQNTSQGSQNELLDFTVDQKIDAVKALVGDSKAIEQVKDLVKKYAVVDTTVLVIGETGTGKELVAKALWQSGPLKNNPFIPINCGAISDHLLQSELFGHKKGAFTGAFQDHKGIFEQAANGVVFLDEIGEISPQMQVGLLRLLESGEYRAVGGNENKKIKCKIVAATNRNLSEHVKNGLFREDLKYRLERLTIEIPALRERSEDIPALINYFLNELNPQLPPLFFDNISLKQLSSLPWQGNIRELRNEMERVRLFYSDKKVLTMEELSDKYKAQALQIPKPSKQLNGQAEKNLLNLKSKFRKLEELKALFQSNKTLSRLEVAKFLDVSSNTAANYLTTLEKENYIKKVNSSNLKSIYFEIN